MQMGKNQYVQRHVKPFEIFENTHKGSFAIGIPAAVYVENEHENTMLQVLKIFFYNFPTSNIHFWTFDSDAEYPTAFLFIKSHFVSLLNSVYHACCTVSYGARRAKSSRHKKEGSQVDQSGAELI